MPSLLPPSSGLFERALETSQANRWSDMNSAIAAVRKAKLVTRPDDFLPWLVEEYGLGEISAFFSDRRQMIDDGIAWQRVRGTPAAVVAAMSWIDFEAVSVLDQVRGRRLWNLFQMNMAELPLEDEDQRLADAEYLADLSSPVRSHLWRGFHGYDVRGNVWGRSRLGRSIWGTSSGVSISGGKTVWSHGRNTPVSIAATEEFLESNGLDVTSGQPVTWAQGLTWDTPTLSWAEVGDAVAVISAAISRLPAYLVLIDEDGDDIALIKCLTLPKVVSSAEGYSIVYDIRTGFGDGAGSKCRFVALSFGGRNAPNTKPFQRYLVPSEVEFPNGEQRLGPFPVNLDLKKTIREFFTVSLLIGE